MNFPLFPGLSFIDNSPSSDENAQTHGRIWIDQTCNGFLWPNDLGVLEPIAIFASHSVVTVQAGFAPQRHQRRELKLENMDSVARSVSRIIYWIERGVNHQWRSLIIWKSDRWKLEWKIYQHLFKSLGNNWLKYDVFFFIYKRVNSQPESDNLVCDAYIKLFVRFIIAYQTGEREEIRKNRLHYGIGGEDCAISRNLNLHNRNKFPRWQLAILHANSRLFMVVCKSCLMPIYSVYAWKWYYHGYIRSTNSSYLALRISRDYGYLYQGTQRS